MGTGSRHKMTWAAMLQGSKLEIRDVDRDPARVQGPEHETPHRYQSPPATTLELLQQAYQGRKAD